MSSGPAEKHISEELDVDSQLSYGWDLCKSSDESVWFLRLKLGIGYEYLTNDNEVITVQPDTALPQYVKFSSPADAQTAASEYASNPTAPSVNDELTDIEDNGDQIPKDETDVDKQESETPENDTVEKEAELEASSSTEQEDGFDLTEVSDVTEDDTLSEESESSGGSTQSEKELSFTDKLTNLLGNSESKNEQSVEQDNQSEVSESSETSEEKVEQSKDGLSLSERLLGGDDSNSETEPTEKETESQQATEQPDEVSATQADSAGRSTKSRSIDEDRLDDDANVTEVDEKTSDESSSVFDTFTQIFSSSEDKGIESDESDPVEQEQEQEQEEQQKESNSFFDKVRSFLDTEEEGVDQHRPDVRNVLIDFFHIDSENGFEWSEEMKTFWGKLRKSAQGDATARRDISGDLRKRYFALLRKNKFARGDLLDVVFTGGLSLVGIGFVFLTGILSLVLGGSSRLSVIMEPSRYGDLFLGITILLGVASAFFWLSRRSNSDTGVVVQRLGRVISGAFFVGQLVLAGFLGLALSFGGGQSSVYALEIAWWNFTTNTLPSYLPPIATAYIDYFGALYTAVSPIGLSIFTSAILMSLVGGITAVPVVKRTLGRFVLTANMGPREFREKTGILEESIEEEDDDEEEVTEVEQQQTQEVVIGDGSEDYTLGEVGSDQTVIAEQQSQEQHRDVGNLIALPEQMRSKPYPGYEEVRRYWVRAPYAYVSIVYNERQNDYRYVVVEPELDEGGKQIFDELKKRLDTVLLFEDIETKEDIDKEIEMKRRRLEQKIMELSKEYKIDINDKQFHRLMYYIERDYVYYNKIDPLMNDPHVEDISCDGEGKNIFVFHEDYKDVITNVKFEKEELRSFITELAQRSGEHISAADPMVDASLPDGSRAQMTLGSSVTTKGSTFTIRLFEDIPFTPVDLLDYDTFNLSQMAYLWAAIEHNKSLIFAGGTASGKTTSMNAVSMFIPPKAKVITIEDTREISLPQENWIPGTTRDGLGDEGDNIDMYELLEAALRQRPEYLIVGEIRGQEAETLFQAMNTGHTTYSTMHAETVDAAVGRLTNPPINVPKQMLTSLDIICIQNQIRLMDEDGNPNNVRRNEEMREILALQDDGSFDSRRPYQWDPETDTFIESLETSRVLTDIRQENGWSTTELEEELEERRETLEYMLDNDIDSFETVSRIIQAYMIDSDNIIKQIRNGTLRTENLSDVTSMEKKEPDMTLSEINDTSDATETQLEADSQLESGGQQ